MFPVAVATLTVIYRHHVRDYLICCSQEERLRFNLQDFWLEANYHNEDLSNLPRYHIFRALIAFICEILLDIIYISNLIKFHSML